MWRSLDEVAVLGHAQNGSTYGHTGCVNAMSWSSDGELLFSSGDDRRLLVWKHDPSFELSYPLPLDARDNCINLRCVNAIRTGHTNNVFAAQQLAPGSSIVATCSRDCQVRVFDLERAGGTSMTNRGFGYNEAGNEARLHVFKCHGDEVKRIVTEGSQSTFLTVAGDRTVRQHDLRTPHTCPRCPPPLVKVTHALSGLGSSPLTPWYFAVAGYSKYGHLFDRRMVGRNIKEEWGMEGCKTASDDLVTCVSRFGRDPERENNDRGAHVTGVRMAKSNGHEVLLSYSGDAVYRYSIYDTPSSPRTTSIIPPNDNLDSANTDGTEAKTPSETAASESDEQDEELEEAEAEADSDSDSDGMFEDSDRDEESPLRQSGCHSNLNRPIIRPRGEYRGAANVRTVKDVNFLGPNDEFVASGSDDGNWFLWSKKSGKLLGIWEGDGSVVNVIEGHPFLPIVAVSGIDDTIKIFEPTRGTTRKAHLENADEIVRQNADTNVHSFTVSRSEIIATLRMLRAAGGLPDSGGAIECPTQ